MKKVEGTGQVYFYERMGGHKHFQNTLYLNVLEIKADIKESGHTFLCLAFQTIGTVEQWNQVTWGSCGISCTGYFQEDFGLAFILDGLGIVHSSSG